MKELISLFIIGVALSMDTFSLALSTGTFINNSKKIFKLSFIVGCMHFIMPLLGMILGSHLIAIFELQCDIVLGIILIIIAIEMIIDLVKKEEPNFKFNIIGMFLFAFGVSIDSFSLGFGLKAITDNIILANSVFAICSFSFTFVGLYIGKFANKYLGVYANIIGAVILAILGVIHLI